MPRVKRTGPERRRSLTPTEWALLFDLDPPEPFEALLLMDREAHLRELWEENHETVLER